MEDLMRISTFWVSAFEGHFGVFFAAFSSWSNYFSKVEIMPENLFCQIYFIPLQMIYS
jgi:hypothetical protein